ncbi:CHAP domain-containing protein [Oecophyllibacter saccharovorans]|uniref:CHAP domain-containing protein n=1 Tax=Oecophyllibacter saccharovorans TaxID=2558360 RepID=UPI0011443B87|nr:CHAP domain-containing protein [Oecophyllibacter saccharovorans]QDH15208.1 CHAP domain-containing protein [Oecophyllibacter saccharovorans]TPW33769.1 CHAP domain-containing protein [Oecophyllibacter saccharovorans]
MSLVPAQARAHHGARNSHFRGVHSFHSHGFFGRTRIHRHYGILQCVAFVKQNSAFNIRGNARDWWPSAAGRFARGAQPEVGSVLAFRGTRRMPLGHVSLVSGVVDNRTILVDHSHWASAGISRNVKVVDVSPNNDWSAVRVALGDRTERLGSIYPTHGFIYSRTPGAQPAHRMVVLARGLQGMQTASLPPSMEVFDDDAPNRSLR